MPIGLGNNITSLAAQRRLAETAGALSQVFERLSSGQRINRASDDAAGLAIADSLNAGARIYNQALRNLNDGVSLLHIADSAIENLAGIVVRLQELAEQAANGAYGNQQRKALDAEAQALRKEYFRISKTTTFNGLNLLSGELGAINLQAGFGEAAVLSARLGGAIGTGAFASHGSFSMGPNIFALTNGDFNGDGILDLVSSDPGTFGGIHVSLGLGDGSFGPSVSFAAGFPSSVLTGDFNGDGILDIVVADGGFGFSAANVFLGHGDGTFSEGISSDVGGYLASFTTGDVNGDGILDLVTVDYNDDTVKVLLGLGDGSFSAGISYAVGYGPRSVSLGDFNGDGVLDVVAANYSDGTVSVLLGLGGGSFAASVSYAAGPSGSVITGDFNGDGFLDLVTADYGGDSVSVLLGLGNGSFAAIVSYAVGHLPVSVMAGDFNGDGVLDLVTANRGDNSVSVLLGLGNGAFAPRADIGAAGGPGSLTLGDFNGDGILDIAAGGIDDGTVSVLLAETRDGVAPLLPFSLATSADARQALPILKQKLNQLSEQRAQLGAHQSRISVAVNVLQVTSENFKAAESRVRDADIPQEAASLVRLRILQQAASAILTQANQQPALALTLLEVTAGDLD